MSLFDSGFSLPAAPVSVGSDSSSRKRKRGGEDKDGLISAAGINVEKLLDKLRAKEGGSSREKSENKGDNAAQTNGTKLSKAEKRRRKVATSQTNGGSAASPAAATPKRAAVEEASATDPAEKRKKKKKRAHDEAQEAPSEPVIAAPAPPKSTMMNGTSLRDQLREKLGGSRFRYINEQLYTISGDEAQKMMDEDSSLFTEYHVGFSGQAKRWPTNPLSLIIEDLKSRPERTTVADLGCGEAELAKALRKHGIRVFSFDLVGDGETVIKAQCSRQVPLPNETMDVVVCCLSLMGDDWLGMIREARRILMAGGMLKIAEVQSRFRNMQAFNDIIERAGFVSKSINPKNSHFTLLDFEKSGESNFLYGDEKLASSLLTPCIYKKR